VLTLKVVGGTAKTRSQNMAKGLWATILAGGCLLSPANGNPPAESDGLVLHLDWAKAQGTTVPDLSGCGNDGRICGLAEIARHQEHAAIKLALGPEPVDRTNLVHAERGKHCGFPNLLRLANGDLLVHFRLGLTHAGERGVIQQVRSTDTGKTWRAEEVVAEDPVLDFRTTSSGIQLPSGAILLPFYPYDAEGKGRHGHPGPRLIVSGDNGRTWSKPILLPNPFRTFPNGYHFCYTCGKIIRLADGTLLLGIHGRNDGDQACTGVVRSVDDGQTWTDFTPVAADGVRGYWEPSFAILKNGHILALSRTEPEPFMYQCISRDNGRSWSKPVKTTIQGDVPELIVLRSGNILCSYRSQEPGTQDTRMCISRDQGQTWTDEVVIDPNGGDHGYTSSVQLGDGSVYTVNYCGKDRLTQIRSNIVRESDFDHPARPGVAGHASVKHSPSLALSGAFSVEAWVNPSTVDRPFQRVVVKNVSFSLFVAQGGRLDGWFKPDRRGTAFDAVSAERIEPGQWTHVAMTYSAADPARHVRLYINGRETSYTSVEKAPAGTEVYVDQSPLWIGSPLRPYAMDGQIGEVRIYRVALGADQVQSHAAAGR
jgi:hypothetical protein